MKKYYLYLLLLLQFTTAYAKANDNDLSTFTKLFSAWTIAFNNKNLNKSCALFSTELKADYRGAPQKTYASLCDNFKKTFNNKELNYFYGFKIHHVFRSGNFAAVRITWYLNIYKNNKLQSNSQDEGIDILQKTKSGWKIINYLAYDVPNGNITEDKQISAEKQTPEEKHIPALHPIKKQKQENKNSIRAQFI